MRHDSLTSTVLSMIIVLTTERVLQMKCQFKYYLK